MKQIKCFMQNRYSVRFLIVLFACVMMLAFGGMTAYAAKTCKTKISYAGTTTTKVNVRKKAGTSYATYGMTEKGQYVTILGWTTNLGMKWYKCKTEVNGKNVTGYIAAMYVKKTAGQTGVVNNKVSSYLNVRKSASTSAKALTKVKKSATVSVTDVSYKSKKYWYKIKTTVKGKNKTGYVVADYISMNPVKVPDEPTAEKPEEQKEPETVMTEEEFQALMTGFPADYQASLRALHTTYPKWKFVAMNTGLDWNAVIQGEGVVGRNVIQSNYPKGTNSLAPLSYLSTDSGAYNWQTNAYAVKDGTNWYSANKSVIAYYMDPRNFLNATDIFQFEALAYDSNQSANVVQSILGNTFMKGNYSVTDKATGKAATGSYLDAFMDAGKFAQVNPYFLATRVKQEVGLNGSNSTSGTYKGYEGLYNFYNIGANDGTNAVANGLNWAAGGSTKATTYGRPWTTPYKSIVGGAQYIASNYIKVGQNTLYFQKFNVKPTDMTKVYQHQYMTNVQAPSSEGRITRTAYNALNILGEAMVFYIPVYNNMPATACQLPAAAGNPNPFLSDISVYNGSSKLALSSAFAKPTATGALSNATYTVTVPATTMQVNIAATAISSKTTVISGAGLIPLNPPGQTTTAIVTGVAANGNRQDYIIHIIH